MDAVTEVKSRLNIEDVVSEYVQLKRAGRNFKALSPFSNEKTPSFIVSPEKQIWHDFSSGKGGDMFSFIQEVEGLDFKGALELLARKAGVDMADFRRGNRGDSRQKDRLFDAVEAATVYYQKQLTNQNKPLEYVRKVREYEKQTILDFRFGYSPPGSDNLTSYLLGKGFTEDELVRAGLSIRKTGGLIDMFRDRLMIPLTDDRGRPVGFTARLLRKDDNAPKYINTPATAIYDKSRQLFNFAAAKEYIRKSGYAVVVEGNLDVVASWQSGVRQVVASAGTALTTAHLKLLQRLTGDIRLAFDDDRAGQEAAERIIPLAQSLNLELYFIKIPAGKDPDELIKQDIKLWQQTVDQPVYMIDWLIDRAKEAVDLSTAPGKRQFTSRILNVLKYVRDDVEQEHYARIIADLSKTSLETIQKKLNQESTEKVRLKSTKAAKVERTGDVEHNIRQQHYLSILLSVPELRTDPPLLPVYMFSELQREFLEESKYLREVKKGSEYAKILTLLFEETYQHTDRNELAYQIRQLAGRLAGHYVAEQKNSILEQLETADEHEEKKLLERVRELEVLKAGILKAEM